MTYECVNTIGLMLDVLGVIVVFKYGWPQPEFPEAFALGVGVNDDPAVPKRKAFHKRMSFFGLVCLVSGFGLQILATWM
jgi:hypothetical protein